MALLRNDQIQAAIIGKLLANSTVTSELSDATEIREDQWQGREFSYPNIRVRMISNSPRAGSECPLADIDVGIQVFSEDASSQEADRIAGIINNELHSFSFHYAVGGTNVLFTLTTTNLIPAIRSDSRIWRAEVLTSGVVSIG